MFLGIGVQTSRWLGQEVRVCLVGSGSQWHLLPQVWCQISVGLGNGSIGSLGEITQSTSGTTSRRVAILNTSHGQQLLGNWGRHDASTTGSWDQTHRDGAALAGNLAGHGMGLADFVAPVATTHRHNRQLGQDDGTTNSGGNFLAALNAKTNVTVVVTNGNEGLEAGTLTGTGLLLDGHDLQHLIAQRRSQEEIDDLELFNGQRVQVDLLQRLDLALTHKAAQFGDWHPLLGVLLAATSTTTSTASTTATTTTTARAKTTSESTTGWSCVRHSAIEASISCINFVRL
ncbi:Bka, partial [Drosophila busckii]